MDDHDINIVIISDLLSAFGVGAVKAASGEEAADLIEYFEKKEETGESIAFVLMDYIMSGIDGIEAVKRIRSISSVPVYGMNCNITDQLMAAFHEAGAVDVFDKPLTPGKVQRILCECMSAEEYCVPRELISMQETAEQGKSLLRACTKGVPGLNYVKGLRTALFREESFLKILKLSAVSIRECAAELESFVNDSDPVKLRKAANGLRNLFANIGVENMLTESEIVENTAEKLCLPGASMPNIMFYEHVNDFMNNSRAVAEAIDHAVREYEKIIGSGTDKDIYITPEKPLDARDRAEVISYTQNAIRRFEYDYILEGLEILERSSAGEERLQYEQAIKAVKNFDYDRAEEIISLQTTMQE